MWVAYIGLYVHGEAKGWHHIRFSFSLPCILMWALSLEPWASQSITVTSQRALVILWVFTGLGLQMGCNAYWYLHGSWGFEPWSPNLHGKLFAHWLTVSALVAFLFPVTKYLRRNNIGKRLWRLQSVMSGKHWLQKLEAAGHMVPQPGNRKTNSGTSFNFPWTSAHGMVLSTVRVCFSYSIKPLWKHTHGLSICDSKSHQADNQHYPSSTAVPSNTWTLQLSRKL